MSQTETRKLKMHDALLVSVIRDQAGSLWKGVLEGVQNSVDAGAKRIEVNLHDDRIEIIDDGRGFRSLDEVDAYFATFGTPHEEGDAVFGRFRMGRGQMFNYGVTTYRTGPYRFSVDIQNKGLTYDLEVDLADQPGCRVSIALYEPLTENDRFVLTRELSKAVKYLSVPVLLDGKAISVHPDTVKWTLEDDDAYYKIDGSGSIKLYHLGCFIQEISAHTLGAGGVVVAKKHLMVNMARNAINDQCPIWRRIRQQFVNRSTENNLKKPRLDDAARHHLIGQLVTGQARLLDVAKVKLLLDTNGRWRSLQSLIPYHKPLPLAFAEAGDRVADRVMAAKVAVVLDRSMLDVFGVETPGEWFDLLERIIRRDTGGRRFRVPDLVDMEQLREQFHQDFEIIPESRWTPWESIWLTALAESDRYYSVCDTIMVEDPDDDRLPARHVPVHNIAGEPVRLRKFLLGHSDMANAWTDGKTYIAINRSFLSELQRRDYRDCVRLASLVLHEYCHNEDSSREAHVHDAAFYQAFHDSSELIARLSYRLEVALATVLRRRNKSLVRDIRRAIDRKNLIQHTCRDIEQQLDRLDRENMELARLAEQKKALKKAVTKAKQRQRQLKRSAA